VVRLRQWHGRLRVAGAVLLAALSLAMAQPEKPLLVGSTQLQASYPLDLGVSYTPARSFAEALGLGYLESEGDVYLILGARGLRIPILPTAKEAVRADPPAAFVEEGRTMIPVKRAALALGATYVGSDAGLRVSLPPARFLGQVLVTRETQDRLTLAFSRDVNVVAEGQGRFLILGARGEEAFVSLSGYHLFGLQISDAAGEGGMRFSLLGAEGVPVRFGPMPKGLWVEVGAPLPKAKTPRVVLDGGVGAYSQSLAAWLADRLRQSGIQVEVLSPEASLRDKASRITTADVFLSLETAKTTTVYTYRKRGQALALAFVQNARRAIADQTEVGDLSEQVAPEAASLDLAQRLAQALGATQGRAEVALLAFVAKAGAYLEVDPQKPLAEVGAKIVSAILDVIGGTR